MGKFPQQANLGEDRYLDVINRILYPTWTILGHCSSVNKTEGLRAWQVCLPISLDMPEIEQNRGLPGSTWESRDEGWMLECSDRHANAESL